MAKAIVTAPDAGPRGTTPLVPWDRTVIYELHVRGFTMRHPAIPEALRGTFAALAHPAAIAHLTAPRRHQRRADAGCRVDRRAASGLAGAGQ